jgi:hypothetical protein
MRWTRRDLFFRLAGGGVALALPPWTLAAEWLEVACTAIAQEKDWEAIKNSCSDYGLDPYLVSANCFAEAAPRVAEFGLTRIGGPPSRFQLARECEMLVNIIVGYPGPFPMFIEVQGPRVKRLAFSDSVIRYLAARWNSEKARNAPTRWFSSVRTAYLQFIHDGEVSDCAVPPFLA